MIEQCGISRTAADSQGIGTRMDSISAPQHARKKAGVFAGRTRAQLFRRVERANALGVDLFASIRCGQATLSLWNTARNRAFVWWTNVRLAHDIPIPAGAEPWAGTLDPGQRDILLRGGRAHRWAWIARLHGRANRVQCAGRNDRRTKPALVACCEIGGFGNLNEQSRSVQATRAEITWATPCGLSSWYRGGRGRVGGGGRHTAENDHSPSPDHDRRT